nr:hypothetical protein [Salmon gill poxvirus]
MCGVTKFVHFSQAGVPSLIMLTFIVIVVVNVLSFYSKTFREWINNFVNVYVYGYIPVPPTEVK